MTLNYDQFTPSGVLAEIQHRENAEGNKAETQIARAVLIENLVRIGNENYTNGVANVVGTTRYRASEMGQVKQAGKDETIKVQIVEANRECYPTVVNVIALSTRRRQDEIIHDPFKRPSANVILSFNVGDDKLIDGRTEKPIEDLAEIKTYTRFLSALEMSFKSGSVVNVDNEFNII